MESRVRHTSGDAMAGVGQKAQYLMLWWEALLQMIDSTLHLIRWVWSPSHQGIPSNEQADRLAERGRRMHPFFVISISSPPPVGPQFPPSLDVPRRPVASCVLLLDEEDIVPLQALLFKYALYSHFVS